MLNQRNNNKNTTNQFLQTFKTYRARIILLVKNYLIVTNPNIRKLC